MSEKKKYDSTVARIAGNITAGLVVVWGLDMRESTPGIEEAIVSQALRLAREIVRETERTDPRSAPPAPEAR